mmetsp:Transcript_13603/g.21284  ORF Transcript_13603/g.21284 Transcript_13603/m.21284 type:complete len:153 (-) Transcript_13603:9-467(-)
MQDHEQLKNQLKVFEDNLDPAIKRVLLDGETDENRFDNMLSMSDGSAVEGQLSNVGEVEREKILVEHSNLKNRIYHKGKAVEMLEERYRNFRDEIDLHNEKVPAYYVESRHISAREEESEYEQSRNDLIEIRLGAEEGLRLLKEALVKEMDV